MSRIISEAFWKESFLRPDGRYDGKKFEQLALELLERIYGHGWRPTASSHDGSRDYEKVDKDGWMWAECKAYSDKLSIYVLSPTLVMALLEQPHTIIVISRSRLNKNAVRHLSSYQAISGKSIIAYDGDVLDHAVINSSLHNLYFPGLKFSPFTGPKLQTRCYISQDALSNPSDLDSCRPLTKSSKALEVMRFGLLRIDIIVRNLSSSEKISAQLAIEQKTLDPSLRVVAFGGIAQAVTVDVSIPPGGLLKVNLILQPLEPRESLSLPRVGLIEREIFATNLDLGSIRISNLYQIDLVGQEHRRIVDTVDGFLRQRRRNVFVAVEGSSGTGKSRILQEISVKGIEHGYRCHLYNPELEDPRSAERIVRSLLAGLCDLPLTADSFNEVESLEWGGSSSATTFTAKVLYDKSFPIWEHTDSLVDAVIDRLLICKTLIIIDNVQFAGDALVKFFDKLTSALNTYPACRTAIALCFNSDYTTPESPSGRLLAKLRAWSAASREQSNSTVHCSLHEFGQADVVEFIGRALSGNRNAAASVRMFEETLKLLIQYVQPRPLNLWQSLMYLADAGVLSFDGERLQVRGEQTLAFRIQSLPTTLQDLLRLRWERIKANEVRNDVAAASELESTLRAAYLLGSDHRDRILALGGTGKAISDLIHAGILSAESGGRVRFFHHQLFIFARSMYIAWEQDLAHMLRKRMEHAGMRASKFQPFFILSHFAGEVTSQLVAATITHMAEHGLSTEYWKQYTDILLSYLMSPKRKLGRSCLQGVSLISQWEQRLESLDRGAATLCNFLASRLLPANRARIPGDYLFHFYQEAINGFLSIHSDDRALEVIDLALKDLDLAQFNSDNDKKISMGIILNRRTATLKNFDRIDEALLAGQEALSIFRQTSSRSLEVETLFDIGSTLLCAQGQRDAAWATLEEGCRVFESHREQMREPAPCRNFYVRGQIALHGSRFSETYCICSSGIAYCRKINNHFWGVRILILEIVARLLASTQMEELHAVELLLIQAWDWVNVNHAERSRWGLSYLEGKYLLRRGALQQAKSAFTDAINSLTRKLCMPEQIVARRNILQDIAAYCRRHKILLDQCTISHIPNSAVQSEINMILDMSPKEFKLFEAERMSKAFFCYNGEIVELP
jgi:hypothetical protein